MINIANFSFSYLEIAYFIVIIFLLIERFKNKFNFIETVITESKIIKNHNQLVTDFNENLKINKGIVCEVDELIEKYNQLITVFNENLKINKGIVCEVDELIEKYNQNIDVHLRTLKHYDEATNLENRMTEERKNELMELLFVKENLIKKLEIQLKNKEKNDNKISTGLPNKARTKNTTKVLPRNTKSK